MSHPYVFVVIVVCNWMGVKFGCVSPTFRSLLETFDIRGVATVERAGRRDGWVARVTGPGPSRVSRVLLLRPMVSVQPRRMQVRREREGVLGTSRRRALFSRLCW